MCLLLINTFGIFFNVTAVAAWWWPEMNAIVKQIIASWGGDFHTKHTGLLIGNFELDS